MTADGDTIQVERASGAAELRAVRSWEELELSPALRRSRACTDTRAVGFVRCEVSRKTRERSYASVLSRERERERGALASGKEESQRSPNTNPTLFFISSKQKPRLECVYAQAQGCLSVGFCAAVQDSGGGSASDSGRVSRAAASRELAGAGQVGVGQDGGLCAGHARQRGRRAQVHAGALRLSDARARRAKLRGRPQDRPDPHRRMRPRSTRAGDRRQFQKMWVQAGVKGVSDDSRELQREARARLFPNHRRDSIATPEDSPDTLESFF